MEAKREAGGADPARRAFGLRFRDGQLKPDRNAGLIRGVREDKLGRRGRDSPKDEGRRKPVGPDVERYQQHNDPNPSLHL